MIVATMTEMEKDSQIRALRKELAMSIAMLTRMSVWVAKIDTDHKNVCIDTPAGKVSWPIDEEYADFFTRLTELPADVKIIDSRGTVHERISNVVHTIDKLSGQLHSSDR